MSTKDEYPNTQSNFTCELHKRKVVNDKCSDPVKGDVLCNVCTANPDSPTYGQHEETSWVKHK